MNARERMLAKVRQYEQAHPYGGDGVRPPPIDVEPAFDTFVEQFGGIKISSLMPSSNARPLNADYLFPADNVVAELKKLEGSFAAPDGARLLSQAFADAGVTESQLSAYIFRREPLPRRAWSLVDKRFRRFLEDRIRKARAQLRRSKIDFGNAHTKSVLLLVNERLTLVKDDYIVGAVCKIMAANYADEHIDAVVYFAPNVYSFQPGAEREYTIWFPSYTDATDKKLGDFINKLGEAWLKYYMDKCGEPEMALLQFPDTAEGIETLRGSRRRV